jgi:DNA-binding transcriptional LysR family regulator
MNELNSALDRLRLRHLRLLSLLAETGSVRKAAERLHVSQPAVSQMVKDIETAFGGTLFKRTRRGVVPNARMSLLLRRTRVALGEIAAADVELRQVARARPRLRVGANLHLLTYLLPRAIDRMRDEHPELRLVFSEGSSARLLKSLAVGELDCVVGRLLQQDDPEVPMEDFSFWPAYSGRLCVVAHPAHPLARRKKLRLADLADAQWALSTSGGQSRQLLGNLFLREGLAPPEPVIECRPFYANLSITTQLPLLTVVMRAEAVEAQKKGLLRILPVDLDIDLPPIAFFCRRTMAGEPLITGLRQAIIAAGAEIDHRARSKSATRRA